MLLAVTGLSGLPFGRLGVGVGLCVCVYVRMLSTPFCPFCVVLCVRVCMFVCSAGWPSGYPVWLLRVWVGVVGFFKTFLCVCMCVCVCVCVCVLILNVLHVCVVV